MAAAIFVIALIGMFAHTDNQQNAVNVATVALAVNPITLGIAGVTYYCQREKDNCKPATD